MCSPERQASRRREVLPTGGVSETRLYASITQRSGRQFRAIPARRRVDVLPDRRYVVREIGGDSSFDSPAMARIGKLETRSVLNAAQGYADGWSGSMAEFFKLSQSRDAGAHDGRLNCLLSARPWF